MALSDYDKKYLDRQQQQAVLTYTAQYERAIREGNQKAAQMAHEGAAGSPAGEHRRSLAF